MLRNAKLVRDCRIKVYKVKNATEFTVEQNAGVTTDKNGDRVDVDTVKIYAADNAEETFEMLFAALDEVLDKIQQKYATA